MMFIMIGFLPQLVERLQARWGKELISVVLFGSYASKTQREDSDIDLLVVRKNPPLFRLGNKEEIHDIAKTISEEFDQKLTLILLSPESASITKPYYLDMTLNCNILFDRDQFFSRVLKRLRRRLKKLGSRWEVDSFGNRYWILKEKARPGEAIIL